MHHVMNHPVWHAPFDQDNTAATARMIHAQTLHGMEAAYEQEEFLSRAGICKQLTASSQGNSLICSHCRQGPEVEGERMKRTALSNNPIKKTAL